MGIGKILGSISPVAGAVTGEGVFGKGLAKLADSGMGMLVPMSYLAKSQRDKKARTATTAAEAAAEAKAEAAKKQSGMRRGGAVKKMAMGGSTASKRADGCATKGKTKGRFV